MAKEQRFASPGEKRAAGGLSTVKGGADLSRPLLPQIGALGGEYWGWVHESISPAQAEKANTKLVEEGDLVARRWPRSLRVFENTLTERLSHIPWWLIPLVWVPIVVMLFVGAVRGTAVSPTTALLWASGGLFSWTLAEYLLHRFAFHYSPRTSLGHRLHFMAHGIHHLDPWDPTRLVFPPLAGVILAAAIFGLISLVLPLGPALAWMSGFLVGYIAYDLTHYYTHHGRPRSRWGKFLRAYHMSHHYRYQHEMYGVSQPLWDVIFRTGRPVS